MFNTIWKYFLIFLAFNDTLFLLFKKEIYFIFFQVFFFVQNKEKKKVTICLKISQINSNEYHINSEP